MTCSRCGRTVRPRRTTDMLVCVACVLAEIETEIDRYIARFAQRRKANMITQPHPGNRDGWCSGCNRLAMYCGCATLPEQVPPLEPPKPLPMHAGVCRLCKFWVEIPDVYIAFTESEAVICEACHRRVIDDVRTVSPRLRKEVEALVP